MQHTARSRPGPVSAADVGAWFRHALRKWSDADVWLATPLPRLIADDELDGALRLRAMTRQVLAEAEVIFADDTPSAQAKLGYVRARAHEMPIARVARELHKGRRTLVSIQTRTDRLLTELFLRKFSAARASRKHAETIAAALGSGARRRDEGRERGGCAR